VIRTGKQWPRVGKPNQELSGHGSGLAGLHLKSMLEDQLCAVCVQFLQKLARSARDSPFWDSRTPYVRVSESGNKGHGSYTST
jgi:hypothetical protein